jgi:hypothetical protein
MRFFVVAVCKSEVIDFVTSAADTFGKRDICVLHEAIKFGVVELVGFVESIDLLHVDEPNTLVDGLFDPVFRHPATAAGIENTEGENEAKSET